MNIGLGVDVGGTHISCCAVNLSDGQLIKNTFFEKDVNSKGTKEEIFRAWADPINKTLDTLSEQEILGIGFGMPGAFNYRKGIGLFENNDKYYALCGVDVKQEFSHYLKRNNLRLRFINDATAFSIGSAWSGKAKGTARSMCITLGTGFGSSFVESGVPVVSDERVPLHGSLWHLSFKDSIADNYFSTRWFVNAFKKETNLALSGVKEIITAGHEETVDNLFSEFGANLALLLTPWIRSFDPDVLVVAGNISRAWNRIESPFQEALTKYGLNLRVEISTLMEEAAISGGSRLLEDKFWSQVRDQLPLK